MYIYAKTFYFCSEFSRSSSMMLKMPSSFPLLLLPKYVVLKTQGQISKNGFSENIVRIIKHHNMLRIICHLPWQNKHPNLKTTYHIKSEFIFLTKLFENLLLTACRISHICPCGFKVHRVKYVIYFLITCSSPWIQKHVVNVGSLS